jgi:hypothetical protein
LKNDTILDLDFDQIDGNIDEFQPSERLISYALILTKYNIFTNSKLRQEYYNSALHDVLHEQYYNTDDSDTDFLLNYADNPALIYDSIILGYLVKEFN